MDPKITNTLIQEICTIVSARYIFPEVADSIVAFLDRQCLDGIYAACSSRDDLAERITSDLRRTANDEHLRVR
jgi:hypothetical protein